MELNRLHRDILLKIARSSIRAGLENRSLDLDTLEKQYAFLNDPGASFVTLYKAGSLRGCIGSLVPRTGLARDISSNAALAAFEDPRFPPLNPDELSLLEIHISILTPQKQIYPESDAALCKILLPRKHGLTIVKSDKKATFLPDVWEQLPEPQLFLKQLKKKGGFPEEMDVSKMDVFIYTTLSFGEGQIH